MTRMVRWDPVWEPAGFRRLMERFFDDFPATRSWRGGETAELTFPVDISETEDQVLVKAALPGIKPDDVEISVAEGVLNIKGESRYEEKTERENYYSQEIRYGAFARSVPLPSRVNYEQAEAEFKDGILTIRLPKAEEVRPKSIKIKGTGELVGAGSTGDGSGSTN